MTYFLGWLRMRFGAAFRFERGVWLVEASGLRFG